ncbi:MAG: protein phosphatase CheZ [Gammaproteobacteria bacterium]|nr:protein phosphatase CheZ [Gammaproteobacteria bacterium]
MDHGPEYTNDVFISELREVAGILVDKLEGDHYEEAMEVINRLVEVRDQSVFSAVGNLTRALHEAIKNVGLESNSGSDGTPAAPEMTDVSDRLSYVIDLTQAAADKTLEKVEAAVPVATALGRHANDLRDQWRQQSTAGGTDTLDPAVQHKVEEFLAEVDTGTSDLRGLLQDILLEQGYQDLTGQVLARVITLIKSVEHDLVELVKIAGQVEYLTGQVQAVGAGAARESTIDATRAEGPNVHGDRRQDVVHSQDEVDDLLSQLGF